MSLRTGSRCFVAMVRMFALNAVQRHRLRSRSLRRKHVLELQCKANSICKRLRFGELHVSAAVVTQTTNEVVREVQLSRFVRELESQYVEVVQVRVDVCPTLSQEKQLISQ